MDDNDLEDPRYARYAWARYRRILWWMVLASVIVTVIGMATLYAFDPDFPLLAAVFSAGGIFFTVLLAAALMGLVFLSSGSGHDERIDDPTADIWDNK